MSILGTVQQHMAHGFTQAEAEALETVIRDCDHASRRPRQPATTN